MSSVPNTTPDGFEVAPSASDHLVKMAIPVPGRDPVKLSVPERAWMDPKDVKAYADWLDPIQEAWGAWNEWLKANDGKPDDERTEPPFPESELPDFTMREVTLRWLKPYASDVDYEAILDSCADGTVEWIRDKIHGPQAVFDADDVSVGESSASTDS